MRKKGVEGSQKYWFGRFCCAASLGVALAVLGGCGGQKAARETKPRNPSPQTSPSPSPFPIAATVQGLTLTITDAKGVRVAVIKARAGTVGPQKAAGSDAPSGDATGALAFGVATLYQNGEPRATFAADRINADRASKTVVGVGNVRVWSLPQKGEAMGTAQTTARADTATWRYGNNKIVGSGNVVIARGNEFNLPGKSFEADTAVRSFTITGSGVPATGTF